MIEGMSYCEECGATMPQDEYLQNGGRCEECRRDILNKPIAVIYAEFNRNAPQAGEDTFHFLDKLKKHIAEESKRYAYASFELKVKDSPVSSVKQKEGAVRELPIVIHADEDIFCFFDERLKELRNIYNPHDRFPLNEFEMAYYKEEVKEGRTFNNAIKQMENNPKVEVN